MIYRCYQRGYATIYSIFHDFATFLPSLAFSNIFTSVVYRSIFFFSATVWLSTAPSEALTHWYQVRCLLRSPLFVKAGEVILGKVVLRSNKRWDMNWFVNVQLPNSNISCFQIVCWKIVFPMLLNCFLSQQLVENVSIKNVYEEFRLKYCSIFTSTTHKGCFSVHYQN